MSDLNASAYYRKREQQERAQARVCIDPGIAAIHTDLANRYAALVRKADPEARPRLKSVEVAQAGPRLRENATAGAFFGRIVPRASH